MGKEDVTNIPENNGKVLQCGFIKTIAPLLNICQYLTTQYISVLYCKVRPPDLQKIFDQKCTVLYCRHLENGVFGNVEIRMKKTSGSILPNTKSTNTHRSVRKTFHQQHNHNKFTDSVSGEPEIHPLGGSFVHEINELGER